MALTFAVGSIAYDLGQSDAEKSYTGQIASLQEQAKYSEEVSNTLRENRDAAESRALKCLRALDSGNHYLAYKGNILYDVYMADTPEKMEKAKSRVDSWNASRDETQERLDRLSNECTGD